MKKKFTQKTIKKSDELHEEFFTYPEISWEEALSHFTGGHIVKDTKGNIVTDQKVIKIVQDAMQGRDSFECGGEFKKIMKNKN